MTMSRNKRNRKLDSKKGAPTDRESDPPRESGPPARSPLGVVIKRLMHPRRQESSQLHNLGGQPEGLEDNWEIVNDPTASTDPAPPPQTPWVRTGPGGEGLIKPPPKPPFDREKMAEKAEKLKKAENAENADPALQEKPEKVDEEPNPELAEKQKQLGLLRNQHAAKQAAVEKQKTHQDKLITGGISPDTEMHNYISRLDNERLQLEDKIRKAENELNSLRQNAGQPGATGNDPPPASLPPRHEPDDQGQPLGPGIDGQSPDLAEKQEELKGLLEEQKRLRDKQEVINTELAIYENHRDQGGVDGCEIALRKNQQELDDIEEEILAKKVELSSLSSNVAPRDPGATGIGPPDPPLEKKPQKGDKVVTSDLSKKQERLNGLQEERNRLNMKVEDIKIQRGQ